MGNAFRYIQVICIIVVLGAFLGCGSDNGVTVDDTDITPDPPAMGGTIGVYATPDGSAGKLYDTGGLVTVYVVHDVPEGARALEFSVDAPNGWRLTGSRSEFPLSIGDVNSGISIAYGECLTGPVTVMTLTYRSPGNVSPGAAFKVQAHPHSPDAIQVVDCENNILEIAHGVETPVDLSPQVESDGTGTDDKRDRDAN